GLIHLFQIGRLCPFPASGPAFDLAPYEARGLAQVDESARLNVNRVQTDERINQALADPAANLQLVSYLRRNGLTYDNASPPLHQIKRRADHARVLAQQIRFRRQVKMRADRGEQPVFARHVVSRRRDWAERWPAHHEFTIAQPNAVGQV